MPMRGITKGRLLALVLLAIVAALPLLWLVQQKAVREDAASRRNSTELVIQELRKSAHWTVEELRATKDTVRKQELLRELSSAPEAVVDSETLWALIGELPEGERSMAYLQSSERFAAADPARYLEILGTMGPGYNRQAVVRNGTQALDFPNLKKLIATVQATGSQEDIEDLAQRFHDLEEPKFTSADLLAYAKTLEPGDSGPSGQEYELRGSLVFGAGKLDANAGVRRDFDSLRAEFGAATADRYIQANLTAMLDEGDGGPESFLSVMAGNTMGPETRRALLNEFAGTALNRSTSEALAWGSKLPEADAGIYFEVLGQMLAGRDSAEARKVVEGMPAGKARELMAAQLAEYLGKKR